MPSFSYLLLSLQGAWAAVTIQVPSSPIHAWPRSDTYLPCHFSLDPPRAINVNFLVVKWLLRGKTIAKFDTSIEAFRPRGAVLDEMRVREGNATLLLPDVRDEDAGEYTCFVLHTPDSSEGKVALKVEASPRLTLGPTEVLLLKPSKLTCTASDFYPGNVSVSWLRDGEILKVDSPPVQERPNGLFFAQSVLEFTPQISDAGIIFSCRIHHRTSKDPVPYDFELKMKARPDLHMLSRPRGKTFIVTECLVFGFYPRKVKVLWLQNGEPLKEGIYESDFVQNPNGTFSIGSVFIPQLGHSAGHYTCQVQHETLELPLEKTIAWAPEAPGFFQTHMGWLLGLLGLVLGLGLGGGAATMYYKNRTKYKQAVPNDETSLKKMREDAESQEGKAG